MNYVAKGAGILGIGTLLDVDCGSLEHSIVVGIVDNWPIAVDSCRIHKWVV